MDRKRRNITLYAHPFPTLGLEMGAGGGRHSIDPKRTRLKLRLFALFLFFSRCPSAAAGERIRPASLATAWKEGERQTEGQTERDHLSLVTTKRAPDEMAPRSCRFLNPVICSCHCKDLESKLHIHWRVEGWQPYGAAHFGVVRIYRQLCLLTGYPKYRLWIL